MFLKSFLVFKYNFCFSSTTIKGIKKSGFSLFKYNFCFSSTIHFFVYFTWQWDLNTTFVSLQQLTQALGSGVLRGFKYNFCFSSTVIHLQVNQANLNLNTTFVSLQRYILVFLTHPISDLNTTFVSLQLLKSQQIHLGCTAFKYNFCFSSTVIQVCTSGE